MKHQLGSQSKALSAPCLCAFILFLSCVCAHMTNQSTAMGERFITSWFVAVIRLLACVTAHMRLQVVFKRCRVPTFWDIAEYIGVYMSGSAKSLATAISQGFYSRWGQLAHLTKLQFSIGKRNRQKK